MSNRRVSEGADRAGVRRTRFDPNGAPPQQVDVTRVLAARGRAL
jgi:hypothetical protein